MTTLADMGADQLIAALADEDAGFQRDAARMLGMRRERRAVQPLIAVLNDPDRCDAREEAALALGQIGDEAAIGPLLEMFYSGYGSYNASRALSQIGGDRVVEALIEALRSEQRLLRGCAAEALADMRARKAAEPLIALLQDPDAWVREEAALALGPLHDRRAVEPLLDTLSDPASKVILIRNAIFSLGRLRDPRAVEPLIAILKRRYGDPPWAAAGALGVIRDLRAVTPLIEALEDADPLNWTRAPSAMALGRLRDPRAFEPLAQALKDEDVVVRIAAAEGLGWLGDERALPLLEQARDSDHDSDEFGFSVDDMATRSVRWVRRWAAVKRASG